MKLRTQTLSERLGRKLPSTNTSDERLKWAERDINATAKRPLDRDSHDALHVWIRDDGAKSVATALGVHLATVQRMAGGAAVLPIVRAAVASALLKRESAGKRRVRA